MAAARFVRPPAALLITALLLATPLVAGCARRSLPLAPGNGVPAVRSVAGRGVATPKPTLENLWPHEDGRTWVFRGRYVGLGLIRPALYDSPGRVPAITLDDAEEIVLGRVRSGSGAGLMIGLEDRLRFDGTVDVGGVHAQNLIEEFRYVDPVASPRSARMPGPRGPCAASFDGPFEPPVCWCTPQLLRPGAWCSDAGSVRILSQDSIPPGLEFDFLEADLDPHAQFQVALRWRGGLIRESARVLGVRTWHGAGGDWKRAVEMLYLVDYGALPWPDSSGTFRFTRPFTCGAVVFVPDVGPVRDVEYGGFAGSAIPWVSQLTMELESTTRPPATIARAPRPPG